jgi:hypothetical protein
MGRTVGVFFTHGAWQEGALAVGAVWRLRDGSPPLGSDLCPFVSSARVGRKCYVMLCYVYYAQLRDTCKECRAALSGT